MKKINSLVNFCAVAMGGLFAMSAFAGPVGFASLNGGTTGGEGGKVVYAKTGTDIHSALCNRASSDTPIIIYVEGTINHGNTSKVSGDSCNTAADRIELKEISNVSLIGTGSGALFDELGIHIRKSSNIILQNLHVRNVKKSGSPKSNGGDAIGMESSVSNVWVDHCTLEASGGEKDGYDGLFDMKADTKYVTLSYSILRNSGRGGLVGSSKRDKGNGPVTYHHNFYQNLDSRVPLFRGATGHKFNNYYNGINKSGINSRVGGKIKVENNYFVNAKDPLGTFYTDDMGYWEVSGNIWGSGVTWTAERSKNHPAGPNPVSTTTVHVSYDYRLDKASCVPSVVMATAGANKGLARSNGSCGVVRSSLSSTPKLSKSLAFTSAFPGVSAVSVSAAASVLLEENTAGFCGVDGAIESEHSGFTGSGYANTSNESGTGVDYSVVVPASGSYTLAVRYANASGARNGKFYVNGVSASSIALGGTGGWGTYINSGAVTLSLQAGHNSLRLEATGSSGLPNIDSLTITGNSPEAGDCSGGVVPTPTSGPMSTPTPTPTPKPTPTTGLSGGCSDLINNPNVNWRESTLQSDQEIVKCLKDSLGTPVGYGEKATGGYDANGGSKLVVITKDKAEDQILAAISSTDHNWIVFDKDDFANETHIMMYRPYCTNADLQTALGVGEQTCRDPYAWCNTKGISSGDCLEKFFNDELNDKKLPIRNYLVDSNTTIDGRGAKATFLFNGFKIGADSSGKPTHTSKNVIITNNKFIGVGHTEDHGLDPDMIRSTGESHDIWIHQNTFDTTGDSAFDVKVGAYNITASFNKLINVKRAALHGSSDSRTINQQITSTIHNNLFVTTDENFGSSSYNTMRRVPLLRRGQTHMFNNVFYGYRKDIMSLRKGARALVEDNLFMNPVINSKKDDLADWDLSLFDDAIKEGSLKIDGSYVYESNSSCTLAGANASLDDSSSGSVPAMYNDYNSASKSTINANRFIVSDDLRDYVLAAAGKGGMIPYLSSYSAGESTIIAAAPSSCQ